MWYPYTPPPAIQELRRQAQLVDGVRRWVFLGKARGGRLQHLLPPESYDPAYDDRPFAACVDLRGMSPEQIDRAFRLWVSELRITHQQVREIMAELEKKRDEG